MNTLAVVVNPSNLPLAALAAPPRPENTELFWERAGIEPILIRLEDQTGLTLCTPTLHDDETRTLFLADERLHVARTTEGLVELVRGAADHMLAGTPRWGDMAYWLEPRHIEVLPEYRFDIVSALESIAEGEGYWNVGELVAAYDLGYELAKALDLTEFAGEMEPGSTLYEVYSAISELGDSPLSRWGARRRLAGYNLVSIYNSWTDIADMVAEHLEWHD